MRRPRQLRSVVFTSVLLISSLAIAQSESDNVDDVDGASPVEQDLINDSISQIKSLLTPVRSVYHEPAPYKHINLNSLISTSLGFRINAPVFETTMTREEINSSTGVKVSDLRISVQQSFNLEEMFYPITFEMTDAPLQSFLYEYESGDHIYKISMRCVTGGCVRQWGTGEQDGVRTYEGNLSDSDGAEIYVSDESKATKLATALSELIRISGGKKTSY